MAISEHYLVVTKVIWKERIINVFVKGCDRMKTMVNVNKGKALVVRKEGSEIEL